MLNKKIRREVEGPTFLLEDLRCRLTARATIKTRDWWDRYLKGVIRFRGVKMGDIRESILGWHADHLASAPLAVRLELALRLLREPLAEDKLAAILYLEEILIPEGQLEWPTVLHGIAAAFDDGFIADWNTCDWLCVKALSPLARQFGESCARGISDWRTAANLWRRRASGVAFVTMAKNGEVNFPGFTSMLLEVCASTVSYPERFAQTGTGWVLRELSIAERERVVEFIETNMKLFSKEGLRYAIAKLPESHQKAILRRHGVVTRSTPH